MNKNLLVFVTLVCLSLVVFPEFSLLYCNPYKLVVDADASIKIDGQKDKFIGNVVLSLDGVSISADTVIIPNDFSISNNIEIIGNTNIEVKNIHNSITLNGESFKLGYQDGGKNITVHLYGEKAKYEQVLDQDLCSELNTDLNKQYINGSAREIIFYPIDGLCHFKGSVKLQINDFVYIGSFLEYNAVSCQVINSIY